MTNTTKDMLYKLRAYKKFHGMIQTNPCSEQDNRKYRELLRQGQPLPPNVFQYINELSTSQACFYEEYRAEITDAQVMEFLAFKQEAHLNTIKKCVVFFTVLACIGLLLGILSACGLLFS